ncbi:DNA mismatch repair protein MutS [Clostridium moniliforme]|uniref:DNA mismatch repair protein MutS n=1 Tax=Clostridium moniliforme TaxID=39489 RepID=A0ABS4EWT9_9CLOT|nr:DNA mismatch repair protein MutS [Clostridium moniliforme]MBP1888434.1 DNA mismatch repair protein MutS [Clostridium moniliforme]
MGLTPMMKQYFEIKDKYNDCILFFRLGDFYEMFFDDAKTASRELELVLTGRDCGLEERAPMCGIPFHASASYISRLINKGYKVAICEQVEDPSVAKGLVKRDVIKVITPGTYVDGNNENDSNTYLLAIYEGSNNIGLALTDISTGEFKTTSFTSLKSTLFDEITKVNPKEIIIDINTNEKFINELEGYTNALLTKKDLNNFKVTDENLVEQFGENSILELSDESKTACKILLKYIFETQKISLANINFIERYSIVNYMTIDGNSRRNLELTESIREKSKKGSLLWVMDKTSTSMGGRVLRKWIDEPLISKQEIERRLNGVEELYLSIELNEDIKTALKDIYDIERIVGKIANGNVNGKDMVSLRTSLSKLPYIKEILSKTSSDILKDYYENLDVLEDLKELLCKSILDDPSISVKEGNIIKDGYSPEVDELRRAKLHGKEWIASLENSEREFTGIKSLKVGYNKVFGYYIEIRKANYSSIPEGRYIRKQTLANSERFITQELKEMEDKILGAEEKLINLEYSIFLDIRNKVSNEIARLKRSAKIIGNLDSLSTLALIALENDYVKPIVNEEGIINIKEGRHPVVEKVIGRGEFVSNDTLLNKDDNRLLLITGPNMAGKSTYMRQVALITLMAQIGSFVPAKSANISICDKIFTRIGASDDLAGGKSTFMVEMWEVSNILKNATSNSLVLLDEVGRGTSTYDGLSIAWSVIEYISKNNNLKCKTLFATHYHELTKLEGKIGGVKNYSVAVKELDNTIIFLRKIIEGGADESYGIEVAKLAGLPEDVISRAREILNELEGTNTNRLNEEKDLDQNKIEKVEAISDEVSIDNSSKPEIKKEEIKESIVKESDMQIDFTFMEKENLIKELSEVDILSLNPLEAMNKLYKLVSDAKKLN